MMQLMLGNCAGTFHVHFAVPADQADAFAARVTTPAPDPTSPEGLDPEDPVVVTGLGTTGTTIVPRGWVDDVLAGQHGNVQADVIGCDPATGGSVTDPIPIRTKESRGRPRSMPKMATASYQPTRACRAHVKARDQRCRFPGCTASPYFTDLDHVKAWPTGLTDPRNLACLCRRHHRIKQRPGWTVRIHPDGSMDWTDPTGAVRTTQPVDHLGTILPPSSARPGDHRNNRTRSSPGPAQQEAGFGDPVWDGDYWDPDAYTGGPALWLQIHLDLAALRRDLQRTAAADQPTEEPTAVELRYENLLLAEHDVDQHQPLRPVDGRHVRWLDHGPIPWELAGAEPQGGDEPPF